MCVGRVNGGDKTMQKGTKKGGNNKRRWSRGRLSGAAGAVVERAGAWLGQGGTALRWPGASTAQQAGHSIQAPRFAAHAAPLLRCRRR